MNLGRHILTFAIACAFSVTVFGGSSSRDSCDVAISIIDNESGKLLEAPEVLLYPRNSGEALRPKADGGKLELKGLEADDYGLLVINDGYRNGFFRFSFDCSKLESPKRTELRFPMWKGEANQTVVLELDGESGGLRPKKGAEGRVSEDGVPVFYTVVSKGQVNGAAFDLVVPKYPASAAVLGVKGSVEVKVTIGFDGTVEEAEAISGHPLLRKVSEDAARKTIFPPTFISWVPVKVTGVIVYNFN